MSETPNKNVVQIGNCTLILGDCIEEIPKLTGFHSVASDVPYGLDYESNFATDELWGDEKSIVGDQDLTARNTMLELISGLPCFVFGSWKMPRPENTRQVLIWDKGGALGMGALDIPFKPDHEEIYVLGKGFIGRRDRGSVIKCPPVQSMAKNGRVHPTQKPTQLMQELCRKLPGTVLDPFMGSGSTGVACAAMGKPFIGIEIKQELFDIACDRVARAVSTPSFFMEPSS